MLFPWDLYTATKAVGFTDKGNYFEADIPIVGAQKEEIEIKTTNDILRVYFKGNEFTPEFEKQWKLPNGVVSKDVTAKYVSGILTVKVMKPKGYEDIIKVE